MSLSDLPNDILSLVCEYANRKPMKLHDWFPLEKLYSKFRPYPPKWFTRLFANPHAIDLLDELYVTKQMKKIDSYSWELLNKNLNAVELIVKHDELFHPINASSNPNAIHLFEEKPSYICWARLLKNPNREHIISDPKFYRDWYNSTQIVMDRQSFFEKYIWAYDNDEHCADEDGHNEYVVENEYPEPNMITYVRCCPYSGRLTTVHEYVCADTIAELDPYYLAGHPCIFTEDVDRWNKNKRNWMATFTCLH